MSDVVTLKTATATKWWVQIRGRAFGPYSIEQMATFLSEGRVRPTTMVSDTGKDNWTEARRVMALRGLRKPAAANDTEDAANVFVHAEIFSGSWMAFMAALESMGFVCDLGPGLWLVRTRYTSGVIRNTLSQTLERGDRFVMRRAIDWPGSTLARKSMSASARSGTARSAPKRPTTRAKLKYPFPDRRAATSPGPINTFGFHRGAARVALLVRVSVFMGPGIDASHHPGNGC